MVEAESGLPVRALVAAIRWALKPASLLDMEASEVATFDVLLEALDRARGGVDGGIVAAFRVLQIDEIAPLDALVFSVAFGHVS